MKIGKMGDLLAPGSESRSPKTLWTIAYKTWQNKRFTCSGDRLTWKMECFGRRNSRSVKSPWTIAHENRSPKSTWTIAHENRQNWGFTCSEDRLTFKIGRFGCEGQLSP
ncbi:hypothetical protein H5410_044041 [Solanum commersonii]|uniref:Uncharacterized protein n=1 Tax=Solanum commersonii TaxID=4109 RepID=A0A9J5Y102_SOLCO|nr:hypothetical protein H5410_044041 [Solanum commersonii]